MHSPLIIFYQHGICLTKSRPQSSNPHFSKPDSTNSPFLYRHQAKHVHRKHSFLLDAINRGRNDTEVESVRVMTDYIIGIFDRLPDEQKRLNSIFILELLFPKPDPDSQSNHLMGLILEYLH